MTTKNINKLQLNGLETTLAEVFTRMHKCPWHKRVFDKTEPTFTYNQASSGIGLYTVVRCDKCGKHLDITDYGAW